jgi:hypothetical protein
VSEMQRVSCEVGTQFLHVLLRNEAVNQNLVAQVLLAIFCGDQMQCYSYPLNRNCVIQICSYSANSRTKATDNKIE